jgi:IS66 Orf2 like protein
MIAPGADLKIYIATRPIDFRCGHDGLAAKVQQVLRLDPFSGAAFVFRSKRADRIKILVWDRTGLVLVHNDLHSYCISLSHSVEDFGQGVTLLACGDSVDKLIPSAALLLRQI